MFALGVTDLDWHGRMLAEPPTGLVNYWTPTPWGVRLAPGSRWFFMLKAPVRRIGGFGVLQAYEELTVSDAWDRYGVANGVGSAEELERKVRSYAESRSRFDVAADPVIGCILLDGCVFLPPELQVAPEALGLQFQNQIVKFKRFDGELELPFEAEAPASDGDFRLVDVADIQWAQQKQ